jgi:hypothetical protein
MKKRLLIALVIVVVLAATASVVSATVGTIQVWWYEDAQRYNADGTLASSWTNDRIPPLSPIGYIEFRVTGRAYHGGMEWFYNYYPLPNFSASPLVVSNGNGRFAAWARYTSPRSGLPILDKIRGSLTIDPDAGTAYGSYTQYSYIESCDGEAVQMYYPWAEATDDPCVWYGGWTDYTVHGQQLTTP